MDTGTVPPSEVLGLAKAYLLAKSAFNRAYSCFWHTEVLACPDDMGWKLLEVFRGQVQQYRLNLKRREAGIKQAAWEIFRQELVGGTNHRFEDLAEFVKWYRALTNRVGNAIGHLYEFHVDSFGDLVDSYPLAGRELVERALASDPDSGRPRREGFLDAREVENAVLEKIGLQWYKLICGGENYVTRALERAC
jgi:hypothetical protein